VDDAPVTVAILDHPRNVGFPASWHARGYGLFAVNNLGRKVFRSAEEPLVFRLASGESTTFRHRVLILSGAATPAQIEASYRDFQTAGADMSSPSPEGRGGQGVRTESNPEPRAPNELTAAERAAGWRLLFDGRTLKGWRGLGRDTIPTAHWVVADGAIKKLPSGIIAERAGGLPPVAGGDLMSVNAYRDFELTWEWKVAPGANSGLKYNVSEEMSTSLAKYAALGFEYQMLDDDRHADAENPSHRAGALYDLIAPNERKRLRPVGEWNQSTLIFHGNHGEHWLNGQKVVEYDLGTARMDSLLAASKYRSISGFGNRRKGHIVLQDHGDEVYFRNVKLREL
jgi:3-keto-disaccharide hydrolase/methane monooxygenase PmoA-like